MAWNGSPPGEFGKPDPRPVPISPDAVSLTRARRGQIVLISSIGAPGSRGTRRLADLGLRVGATAEITAGDGRGPVVLVVEGSRLALGHRAASRVLVEPLTP